MTDYRALLDDEIWAFIDRTNAFYSAEVGEETIEQQRRRYDEMCRSFLAGYPDGVSAETKLVRARDSHRIPVRRYRAMRYDPHALLLYFHGGGFVVGGLDSHDDICAEICHRTGYGVVSADYRLAPEHKHPVAFDDCVSAFEWAAEAYELPILLAGDSAGGNLAAAISQHTRSHPRKPIGQILIYPLLGGDTSKGSYIRHAEAPMLTSREVEYYRTVRLGAGDCGPDPSLAPLAGEDFSDLPPTIIITAECDPLSSDGQNYRDRIMAAGGKAWWHEEAGLVHGYLRARHCSVRARESFSRIVESIRILGRREWPHPTTVPEHPGRKPPANLHPID